MSRKDVFVVDALRTPVGRFGGSLSSIRPDDLGALVIKSIVARNTWLDPKEIEDVVFGAANQAGEDNRNVARMSLLLAGLPVSVPGVTVNRLCASGLQSILDAYRGIALGEGAIYLAGGTESMTRAPFVMAKADTAFGRSQPMFDTTIGWRFTNPALSELYHPFSMGETAENVARQWNISREAQDVFALNSQDKYAAAHAAGKFASELISVPIAGKKGALSYFEKDEHPRASTLEAMAALKPAFAKDGSVTAGNASGLNDGAACLILVSEDVVKLHNLKPLARIAGVGTAGVDPSIMGIGPVPSSQKALKRAGISVQDLDLVELNEAFASQSLACIQELGLDANRVNVNGGSIAIGHPLGASGARISTTLLHEMNKRGSKWGLATMCIGVGQGVAIVFEGVR